MTFLNPLYLIALTAAAIPIILHLLNLRKSRIVEFSTLSFLKELQRSKIRRLKLRQWLLLALRTLIIIFVVLAFTRPAVQSSFGFLPGTTAKNSVVIVLDNSLSMLVSDENGQLLRQARQKASAVVDLLEAGDEGVLLRTSDTNLEGKEFTAALNALRTEVEETSASFVHGDYRRTLMAAAAMLSRSANFNKEVYIITDRQRSQFAFDTEVQPSMLFDKSVRVFFLPIGTDATPPNAAVTDVDVRNAIFEAGKPVDLRMSILNTSTASLSDALVSVFLNDERVTQKPVNVDAGGLREVEVTVIPKSEGWVNGFVELEDDALPEVNRRYFAFRIPEQIRVLIGPAGGRDARIVSLALNPHGAESEAAQTFSIDALDAGRLPAANLARYDVAVLMGAQDLPPAFLQRLASWVNNGGSLLLFPDADGRHEVFSNTLLPMLGLPAAAGATGSLDNRTSFVTFGNVDFDHPLFATMFESRADDKAPEVDSPELRHTVRLRGSEKAQPLISIRGGDAFLLDATHGSGRVMVFGASPEPTWSNLPFKGIFVPLLNRSMYYLASRDDNTTHMLAGETREVTVAPAVAADAMFELHFPDGTLERVVPKSLPSGLVFPIESPSIPGVYSLVVGEDVLRSIVVNFDPAEANLARGTEEEIAAFFETLGIAGFTTLDRNVSVEQAISEARFGVELWKYMLALALLCAMLEMLIARDPKRSLPEPMV